MNASIDGRPSWYGMVEVHEPAGTETNDLGVDNLKGRPRGVRRLTMAQAVAAKWIARYACDSVGAVGSNVTDIDTTRH